MMCLEPLSEEDYAAWREWLMQDYVEDIMRTGLPEESARKKAQEDIDGGLPDGLKTKDHYIYAVRDPESGEKVGVVWLFVASGRPRITAFIYDIVIYEPYRGKGYGTQTMQAMEARAREFGAVRIGLHVFGHNTRARELYKRLGYKEIHVDMVKEL